MFSVFNPHYLKKKKKHQIANPYESHKTIIGTASPTRLVRSENCSSTRDEKIICASWGQGRIRIGACSAGDLSISPFSKEEDNWKQQKGK